MTEPERPGLLGRAAGALTGRMVETIPPDVVLDHIDVDALLDRIDVNHLLDRVDMDRLLARIDMDVLLQRVDVEELVRRSGVPDLVAESTGRLAGGALDLARRQTPGRAVLRTPVLPVAAALLGVGLLPILVGRNRRALHDLIAGTAVVYDWGDRPAQMPAPLSSFIADRTRQDGTGLV